MSESEGPPEWLGATVQYEGYPMALRVRPAADTAERRACLSQLGALTHQLARVRRNGLPESEYNNSLAELDSYIITSFEAEGGGLTVLVETFAGKRTYYAYVMSDGHARRTLAEAQARYPEADLTLDVRKDANWGLYAEYRRLFPW